MKKHERDLLHKLGYFGPPVEPLWLPWFMWVLPERIGGSYAKVMAIAAAKRGCFLIDAEGK